MTVAQEAAVMNANANGPSLESTMGCNMVAQQGRYLMQQEQMTKASGPDYLAIAPFLDTIKEQKPLYDKVSGNQPVAEGLGLHFGDIRTKETRLYGINLDGKLTDPKLMLRYDI